MRKALFYISFLVFTTVCFQSCKETPTSGSYVIKPDGTKEWVEEGGVTFDQVQTETSSNIETLGKISFGFKEVSAVEYLERKGEVIAKSDLSELEKESVFMLEFNADVKQGKDFFDVQDLSMNQSSAVQYMIGEISNDFKVIQGENTFLPNGVQYEGKIGTTNKIRVTFFFGDVNLDQPYTIEYNDRLFSKGLIQMNKNEIKSEA